MTVDGTEATRTSWDELPTAITTYLTAHQAHDTATAITTFTQDAVVIDEGRTYRGRDEIRTWMGRAAGEYTFTTEFTGATTIDETQVDVLQHLEGNFPGGVADLHFRFTSSGPAISRLVIEP
ncbi:nuclear transport factor 2 family protein [Pseudonocardia sp. MH-G8]|uniref:nuclear transport factor 2 family protein n=1 Tax=Pseudonocardia sp. MH-G8 TaxID=1854588 RepID=UPI000BA02140|nr:nuclear transport factor 2 family protein [Pseudonocardia sp. MH-G8]OZM76807.1 DUF4440 domain-containing protein [Pseudonocardia sp. MH-G8]